MAISTTFKLKFDGAAVQRGLKGVGSSISKLGKSALGIAKAGAAVAAFGVGAVAGLAAIAIKINRIGEEANTSEARLKNIVKSMDLFGDRANKVADRLNDVADATGRMIGEDNKVIRLTQSKLMTFKELAMTAGEVGGAFDRATMAAIDMAAAGFGSAEMNAVQLGKALNDPIKGITALSRSGITFTVQEKAKIATLVESNKMLQAQDMILKAIEKQIGGTATATADGSKKMTESAAQLFQAFSKPFAEGFNSIPNMMENVFPQLKAKAEAAGKLVGTAISEAVQGDTTRLMAIGEMIGEIIMAGVKLSLRSLADVGGQFFLESLESQKYNPAGALSRAYGGSEKHKIGADYQREVAMKEAISNITSKYSAAEALAPTGAHHAPGIRYAHRGEVGNMVDEKGHRIMFEVVEELRTVNRNLAPN